MNGGSVWLVMGCVGGVERGGGQRKDGGGLISNSQFHFGANTLHISVWV